MCHDILKTWIYYDIFVSARLGMQLIDDHLPTLTDGQDGITFAIEGIGGASPGGNSPPLALVALQLLAADVIDEGDLFLFGG